MQLAVPRPLPPGGEGPAAKRAPMPEAKPPAGLRPLEPQAAPGEEPAGAEDEPAPGSAPATSAAAAAFEALGDAVAPGPDGGAVRPAGDDFTWEPPQRPQGGSPSRR